MLYHALIAHKSSSRRVLRPLTCNFQTFCSSRSAAVPASPQALHQQQQQQEQQQQRTNLSVIDFFHPSLSSTLFHYTLNLGVSGYPKSGKQPSETQQQDDLVYSSAQVGDDAYFKRHDALGVADGVGGWRSHKGILACLFTK